MIALTFSWLFGAFGVRDTPEGPSRSRRSPAQDFGDTGPDEAIVVRLRAGDLAEFERIYLGHHRRLLRIAYEFLHGFDDAEDVVQAVFLRLWNNREGLRIAGPLSSYLYGAIRNESLRVLKHSRVVAQSALDIGSAETVPGMGTSIASPDVALERHDINARVDRALETLPERRRLALTLRWGEDMSYRDIGATLGVTEQAAQMLVTRAKRDLQTALGDLS